jgi:uncharacterized protein
MPSQIVKRSYPDKQCKFEIIAVLITACGKFIFMDMLKWKLPFIVAAIVAWTAYVIYQARKHPGTLSHWGFRLDNFKSVLLMILPFGVTAVVIFFLVGWYQNTINLTWHIIPVLILYPIWGVVQQFLVIALVGGNLNELKSNTLKPFFAIFLTALLFGLIHYPFYWLMIGTFFLALFYGYIFFKNRNVYVMGVFHGWLGALFFYTVVNRDPFNEVFGNLFP